MVLSDEEPNFNVHDFENLDLDDSDISESEVEIIEDDDDLNEVMVTSEDDSGASSEIDEIVIPDTDHSIITFMKHKGPVYACAFHPNGKIAASGCKEEMLYVWDSINSDTLLEEKFQDSVTVIKFNHDGKYLAAVDLSGNFTCWKHSNNNYIKINTGKYNAPFWLEWHPQSNVLIIAEKETFCMWKVPTFDVAKYFALESPSEVGCFMPDGKSALIGYDEGYAVILDLSAFTVKSKLKPQDVDSEHGIVSLDAHTDNNLVALGTKKGRVLLFTTKKPKLIGTLEVPEAENGNYIETVKFGRDSLLGLLIVAFNNYLHIYDNSKLVLRNKIVLSGIGTRLVCLEPYACIATTKAVVEICDCRSGLKKPDLQGHCKSIMDITLSKNGKLLMTSSDDFTVKIFDVENFFSIVENRPGISENM